MSAAPPPAPGQQRYGVVRAASNGINAVISPRGEILARRDHFDEGPGVVQAELRLGKAGGPYAHAGEWLPLTGLAGLLLGAWRRRRKA